MIMISDNEIDLPLRSQRAINYTKSFESFFFIMMA